MGSRRACSSLTVALVAALCLRAGPTRAQQSPPARAQHAADPHTVPPEGEAPPLGVESSNLATLRAFAPEPDGVTTVAQSASRAGTPLPAGLDPDFAARLEMPSLEIRLSARVARSLARFRADRHARHALGAWLRHAGRFRARIEATLASEGLPMDLVWVVAAESGFNPVDVSAVGAVGLWQLMTDAAHTYGLRVDAWVDERRDPERSTQAAAHFLHDLHTRFGTWELALAAYNMGYNALLRAMRKYNTNDFETLAGLEAGLPFETGTYVPRILASAIAAHNAAAFGLTHLDPDPVVTWDDVTLHRSVPLEALAHAAHLTVDDLRALNPALLAARTPPTDGAHPFVLHVPTGQRGAVESAASGLVLPPVRAAHLRHGETLDELSASYGTTAADVLALSGFASNQILEVGTDVLVPDREPTRVPATERPVVAVEPYEHPPVGRHRGFYRVGVGDTVESVAHALGVHQDELLDWNTLDPGANLQAGLWLQAFLANDPTDARVWDERDVDVMQRSSDAFLDRTVQRNGRARVRITVGDGDTMASLAARYGLTLGSLARINHCARNTRLVPGDAFVVYARPQPAGALAPGESAPVIDDAAPTSIRAQEEPAPTRSRDAGDPLDEASSPAP